MNSQTESSGVGTNHDLHVQLKELANSLSEIVSSIRAAHEPIVESRSKVPEATQQLERIAQQTQDATHRVLDMVESITKREGEIESLLKQLQRVLPATYFRNNSRVKRVIGEIAKKTSDNQNDAYAIMDALQFQDITSQQIEHAMTVLEQVEHRLHEVLVSFGEEDLKAPDEPSRKRSYDPNARYSSDHRG
ncbi:MAG: protein phosphatase CheZ [candidate division Zixibacteria bacterium]|nr:protein phosphatase CheZ [candidate division Zixibacteria bacterium]